MRAFLYATAAVLAVAVLVVVGAGVPYAADQPKRTTIAGESAFDEYLPGVGLFDGSLAQQYGLSWTSATYEGDFVGPRHLRPGQVCGTGPAGVAFGPSPRPGC